MELMDVEQLRECLRILRRPAGREHTAPDRFWGYHRPTKTASERVEKTFGRDYLESLNITEGKILDAGCSRGGTTVAMAEIFGQMSRW